MDLNLGAIIAQKRKEKGITQQALADFVGVSKASVSKWETGQTYPDITLLPLLASFFAVSTDTLLSYNAQLSQPEMQRIYQSLKDRLNHEPAEEVLSALRHFVRQYYACYPFILQMGSFLLNHYDLLPGADQETKSRRYMEEARALFIHVRNEASDVQLITQARFYEAYTLMALNQPAEVLAILGEETPIILPPESLIAGAFHLQGESLRAQEILQSAIMQYLAVLLSLLGNYLQLLTDQPAKFQETVVRGQKLAAAFNLKSLNPINFLSFEANGILGWLQMNEPAAAMPLIKEFAALVETIDFPVSLHGDDYFDLLEEWLAQLATGNQIPRDSNQVRLDLIRLITANPLMEQLANDEDFKKIQEHLLKMTEE